MAESLTRDGRAWVPAYLDSIDPKACIGCGRCYKVCGRGVLAPIEIEFDDDEDDEDVVLHRHERVRCRRVHRLPVVLEGLREEGARLRA